MYISRVEEGSVADRVGLRPGDSILEVNGTPFTGISHEEALKVSLKVSFFNFCFQLILGYFHSALMGRTIMKVRNLDIDTVFII